MLVRDYRPVMESDLARIEAALAQAGGNKSRAAQLLGMTLRQLNYRMQKAAGRPTNC
jgi:Nif-specific regulatory protein